MTPTLSLVSPSPLAWIGEEPDPTPPPPVPIPGAAPATPPDATARLSVSSRTSPPSTHAGTGARPCGAPITDAAPSPDFLIPVAIVCLVLSLAGPPRATPPLFPAPNGAGAGRHRARPCTWLLPLAAVTRALPSCAHAPRVLAAPSLAVPSAVRRAVAAALSLARAATPRPHSLPPPAARWWRRAAPRWPRPVPPGRAWRRAGYARNRARWRPAPAPRARYGPLGQ
nr:proline-rich protein 36-like [Aegilops tauschii subsp. strangulata]